MAEENTRLKDYINSLEKSHESLATDLTHWQGRWKTTASNNIKLCRQMIARNGRGSLAAVPQRPPLPRVPEGFQHPARRVSLGCLCAHVRIPLART